MIYSVFNIKGGVAKSTFNIFCATALFHLLYGKKKVCLIEFDNNKSCVEDREQELTKKKNKTISKLMDIYPDDFKERLKNIYPIYSFKHKEYHDKFDKLISLFDVIFLDFPGTLENEEDTPLAYKTIKTINKIAIPVLPDEKDRRASRKTMALFKELDIKTGWFMNRATGTKSASLLKELGHDYFRQTNPKIEKINKFNTEELLAIPSMPVTIEKNNSTIIPYLDGADNIRSLVSFFIKN